MPIYARKKLLIFVVLVALLSGNTMLQAQQPSGATEPATVLQIIDGDTISVRLASNSYIRSVRLIGIDAPERGEPCFVEASNALAEMLPTGSEIRLETDVSNEDRYRRPLRYVYFGDVFINAEMIELGWAEAVRYEPDVMHAEEFEILEAEASRLNVGCWPDDIFEITAPMSALATWRVNSGNNINVRSCASTSCGILTSLAAGTVLNVLSTENNWHMIELADGSAGYVAAWLTTREDIAPVSRASQQTTQTGNCTVQGNNVNLRTGPGTNYGIAGSLANGTALRVTGRSSTNDWYVVNLNGRQAWVYSGVITTSGNCRDLRVIQAPPPPTPRSAPAVQSAVQAQPPAQPSGPSFTCNCSKTCSQMASCEEAYFQLNQCGCSQRDGDGDGVPCEIICPGG